MEPEAKAILGSYGVGVTNDVLCRTPEEAIEAARRIGYPVVMKIVSPQIVHKSEYGAVRLRIMSDQEVTAAFSETVSSSRRKIDGLDVRGVIVSETASGQEMIIGSMRDPQFGQMVMFGLGGVNVEIFKDVAYRLAPLEEVDAIEMIAELKGKKLLEGFRGRERVDVRVLTSVLMAVSRLLADFDDIEEMDLNPVFGNERGVKVADARIILR